MEKWVAVESHHQNFAQDLREPLPLAGRDRLAHQAEVQGSRHKDPLAPMELMEAFVEALVVVGRHMDLEVLSRNHRAAHHRKVDHRQEGQADKLGMRADRLDMRVHKVEELVAGMLARNTSVVVGKAKARRMELIHNLAVA